MPPNAPPMPPAGPPPDMGGGSPDEMMMAQEQDAAARKGAIGATAPVPTKPYSVSTVKGLISQFNDTLDVLGGQDLPDVEWAPPDGGSKWNQPLPTEIYAPLYALKQALQEVAGGEFASKYEIDCEGMTDDTQVRKVTGTLARMEKDKKLAEAMQAPAQPAAPADAGPAPAPSQFSEEDEALMKGM